MSGFLDRVLGHEQLKRELLDLVAHQCVPHAFVFGGPKGAGKMTTALSFAGTLFSSYAKESSAEDFHKQLPHLLRAGTYPDLHVLGLEEGKKDIAVDDVRELCEKLRLKPYYPSCSVAIIDSAHRLSIAASNALLMTLEEPVPGCHIFLVTEAPHRLLPTIASRCRLQAFGSLSTADATSVFDRELAPFVKAKGAGEQLRSLIDGTLGVFQLDAFFDRRTKKPTDTAGLTAHLETIAKDAESIGKSLREICDSRAGGPNPLSIASTFSAKEENLDLFWQVFRELVRRKMREENRAAGKWGEILAQGLAAEQGITERNLSPHSFLPEILLRMSEGASR